MNRVLKTFLLWFLVFALPVQGCVAATMSLCGSTHRHALIGTAVSHSHSTMRSSYPAHHHDSGEQVVSSQHVDATSHPSTTPSHDHAGAKCSTCCVGLGIIAHDLVWYPPLDNAEIPIVFPPASFTGFIPPGLERPPRTLLL